MLRDLTLSVMLDVLNSFNIKNFWPINWLLHQPQKAHWLDAPPKIKCWKIRNRNLSKNSCDGEFVARILTFCDALYASDWWTFSAINIIKTDWKVKKHHWKPPKNYLRHGRHATESNQYHTIRICIYIYEVVMSWSSLTVARDSGWVTTLLYLQTRGKKYCFWEGEIPFRLSWFNMRTSQGRFDSSCTRNRKEP